MLQARWLGLIVVFGTALAWWLGSDVDKVVPGLPEGLLAGVVLFLAVALLQGVPTQLIACGLVLAVLAQGWSAGRREVENAFAGCVDRGESVRAALEAHRGTHGAYPASLGALQPWQRCGRLLLRHDLLGYERTETGYRLAFRDWLTEWEATEAEPFAARK